MISEIIYKLNAFDSNFVALSEIITAENAKKEPTIGELQKKYGEFLSVALEQLKLKDKVKKKLPSWVDAQCLFEQRAFEQCTSQRVAEWKSHYFKTSHLLSLTGGFGVDDWAWLKSGTQVISTDPNKELNHLVRCNMQRLRVQNKSYKTISDISKVPHVHSRNAIAPDELLQNFKYTRLDYTAEEWLISDDFKQHIPSPKTKEYTVYMDPDRRKGDDRLGGKAKEFTPDFIKIIKSHFSEFHSWLVKLSPMTDIHFLQKELPYPIRYYSIFFQGEVKELLLELGEEINKTELKSIFIQNEGFEVWDIESIELFFNSAETTIIYNPIVTNLQKAEIPQNFDNTQNDTNSQNVANPKDVANPENFVNNHTVTNLSKLLHVSNPSYLFESHGSLNCLGLNRELSRNLITLNQGKTFFHSSIILPKSLGRTFRIQQIFKGSLKQIKQGIAVAQISHASLTARECKGLNSAEIQKRLGIKEGGLNTLFVTQAEGEFICWVCTNHLPDQLNS
jgi:hypothetical protein